MDDRRARHHTPAACGGPAQKRRISAGKCRNGVYGAGRSAVQTPIILAVSWSDLWCLTLRSHGLGPTVIRRALVNPVPRQSPSSESRNSQRPCWCRQQTQSRRSGDLAEVNAARTPDALSPGLHTPPLPARHAQVSCCRLSRQPSVLVTSGSVLRWPAARLSQYVTARSTIRRRLHPRPGELHRSRPRCSRHWQAADTVCSRSVGFLSRFTPQEAALRHLYGTQMAAAVWQVSCRSPDKLCFYWLPDLGSNQGPTD